MNEKQKIEELEYVIEQWYEQNEQWGFDCRTEKQCNELKSFWLDMCEMAKKNKIKRGGK